MKKWLRNLTTACFLALFACLVAAPAGVSAYGLTQSNPAADSITVSWEPEEDALAYHVYVGENSLNAKCVQDLPASARSATITGLQPGTEYYVNIKYDERSYNGGINTYTAASEYDLRTLPGKVENVRQTQWYYYAKSFWVEWKRQTGVDGYEYQVKKSNGKKFAAKTLSGGLTDYLIVNKISNTTVYTVQLRAFSTVCGKKYYGGWSDKCYCFTQPRVKYAKISKDKLVVKWGKVSGATGYEIYVSTSPKKGYKKVKTAGKSASSATISKFKGKKFSTKKKYYVYVVTVKKVGKRKYTSGKLYYWNTKNSKEALF